LPAPFVHELRVRFGECDPQGIVFNANYLLYFDVAFTEMWRASVGAWGEMVADGVDAVVAETNLSFRAPARFDDELQLHVQVARLGRTATTTEIDVMRGEQLLLAGWLRHVFVSTDTWTKTDIPAAVREGLLRFARADAEQGERADALRRLDLSASCGIVRAAILQSARALARLNPDAAPSRKERGH
jgi:acyl-CoA thioester hydrolase